MGWLIALGVLVALAAIPLGVALRYDGEGPRARLILGPLRLTLYSWTKKEKKETEQPREKKTEPVQTEPKKEPAPRQEPTPRAEPAPKAEPASKPEPQAVQPVPKEEPRQGGGSLKDFLPFVKLGMHLLGDFRRKLRVNILELKLTLAGDDPCDLALNYGRAWAAVGNLIPQLERIFVIKKRDVEVQCDFTASETTVFARMELTITLGRLLALGAVYGVRALREFLSIRNKRKGGAVK